MSFCNELNIITAPGDFRMVETNLIMLQSENDAHSCRPWRMCEDLAADRVTDNHVSVCLSLDQD